MGQDTKIYIPANGDHLSNSILKIKDALIKNLKIKSVKETLIHSAIKDSQFEGYQITYLTFSYKREQRQLTIYYDFYLADRLISLKLGYWGASTELAQFFVDTFGGYADFNDCDDIEIDYAMPQPKTNIPA